ncbi:MAG TPA: trypsin-like peptidase domain-containing protein [Solirubrobacteraceae bacterium]|jgi:putative serine protease PepD|nr:trypsin-like peptidase domain-containing protein [Solirubrobacteraceae bacterium]
MSRYKTVIPTVVVAAVVGGLIALAVNGGSSTSHTTTVVQQTGATGSALPTSFSSSGKALSINQIYRQDSPGVVDIDVVSTSSANAFGATQETQGEGAGVVYDTKGDILTDEHVVTNAQKITVHFQDGVTANAKVLNTDPSTDVAVIHVDVPTSQLHPIPFADSSAAQVGDPVVAIGSPFSLPETVTQGIVSAVGRSITAPNNFTITGAIQTDAAINPGNSGGPLLDASGKVLGLSDQIETNNTTVSGQGSSSGIGFATPGNEDIKIANAIIAGHPVKHSYVGVCLNPSTTGGAQIALTGSQGCTTPIVPGSPAALAGLQPGDTITAIDGQAVGSTEGFISTVDNYGPGRKLALTIKRAGQTKQLSLTLGARPSNAPTG